LALLPPPPPTLAGAPPIVTSSALPATSTSAWPCVTRLSVTPLTVLPTASVCGAPLIISSALLSPMLPAIDTV
jgi:hypothetical protein